MATFYRCDRCGAEGTDKLKTVPMQATIFSNFITPMSWLFGDSVQAELCMDCANALSEWLKRPERFRFKTPEEMEAAKAEGNVKMAAVTR